MLEEEIPELLEQFTIIQDPRAANVSHKLSDILVIAICAVICGANTFTEIEQYGQGKEEWLTEFLELKNGIPILMGNGQEQVDYIQSVFGQQNIILF